jgi:hypothetical protein
LRPLAHVVQLDHFSHIKLDFVIISVKFQVGV